MAKHRWTAGNTAVPFYYGLDAQMKKTVEFLQVGNSLNIDIFGLQMGNRDKLIAPLGSVGFTLKPDEDVEPTSSSKTRISVTRFCNHKVWTIHSVAYDNTIQPGRSTVVRYRFHVPLQAAGPLSITAAVEYRHLRQSYLNNSWRRTLG